jgi:hypothetical protein
MPNAPDSDQHSPEETEQRLRKIMRGAFSGPPTPLAKIPTREGRKRSKGTPSRVRVTKKKT